MKFETLFYLMNENHSVVEIKICGLAADAPIQEVYHWLSISMETKKVEKLSFVSMDEETVKGIKFNVRVFENAELRFDESYAKFVMNNDGHILMNCSEEFIPEQLSVCIQEYISSI
jgi:hypothetical protein